MYKRQVRDTAITFEYDPPDAAEFARRIRKTQEQFPYLVCEVDGKPQAYAYASHFHERAAFQWDAELSVYVAACAQQRGIGRALYTCLIAFLQEQGYSTLYALITVPNDNSERLHAKLGFDRRSLYHRGRNATRSHFPLFIIKAIRKRVSRAVIDRSVYP